MSLTRWLWMGLMILAGTSGASAVDGGTRTAWFSEARYGMFIHWGLSSVPAGSYRGEQYDRVPGKGNGLGEWLMFNAKIPVAEYAAYARQFNPRKFDADAWVRLAKEAGMRYIVFTTKHHEGFAMFKTAASPFNIVDATPFGRDPLKELAEACARNGIRLGLYYSQAQDWHHPGGAAKSGPGYNHGGDPNAGHWDRSQDGDFDEYLTRIAIPQVRELLTHYGPIAEFWWDSPHGMTLARAARLSEMLKLQPQIISNNRLFDPHELNPFSGDTETPEQFIPATGIKGRLFEVCMTMNETWGYKAHDQNWKSAADITRKLIDIASKGGNFLLNVGPDAAGEIPAPSVQRLRESGRWVRDNGESIYGTSASLFRRLPWGRSTTRANTIYLHVFDWPAGGRLVVPGLRNSIQHASLLANDQTVATQSDGHHLVIDLPSACPDPVATVIKLELVGPPSIDQSLPELNVTGVTELPASLAAIVNAYGANARLFGMGADAYIGEWNRAATALNWEFNVRVPATFLVEAEMAGTGGGMLTVSCGKQHADVAVPQSDETAAFRWVPLARFIFDRPGEQALELKSTGEKWGAVRLRAIRLRAEPAGASGSRNQSPSLRTRAGRDR